MIECPGTYIHGNTVGNGIVDVVHQPLAYCCHRHNDQNPFQYLDQLLKVHLSSSHDLIHSLSRKDRDIES